MHALNLCKAQQYNTAESQAAQRGLVQWHGVDLQLGSEVWPRSTAPAPAQPRSECVLLAALSYPQIMLLLSKASGSFPSTLFSTEMTLKPNPSPLAQAGLLQHCFS